MKPIFNSLGSNFDFKFSFFALAKLISLTNINHVAELEKKLGEYLNGKAFCFYKGRDAIEFTLRYYEISKGSSVITQAFSCWAVEEGIIRSGAQAIYADLEKDRLNPSVITLEKAFKKSKKPKAVIIQHTFGNPADIIKIRKWSKGRNLFLIEDITQAIGAMDEKGKLVGSLADAVIISFGRDKVVDGISGGAAIIKTQNLESRIMNIGERKVPISLVIKDLIYPILTLIIRKFYSLGVGKVLHYLGKKLGLMTSPIITSSTSIAKMPNSHASLIIEQFDYLKNNLSDRRGVANLYEKQFKMKGILKDLNIDNGSNLRYPLIVNDPSKLINCLEKRKIYLADRWYKSAVDCGNGECNSYYQSGSCPNAERLSSRIVNLPTHKNINLKTAKIIAEEVKRCLSWL